MAAIPVTIHAEASAAFDGNAATAPVDHAAPEAVAQDGVPEPRHPQDVALEAVFEHVQRTRMADLDFLNARLRVEAIGFRDWNGARVGALVTPWSIVIMILPGTNTESVPRLATGRGQEWAFPSGTYEFHGHEEPSLGHYQQCSLFSPVLEFESQDAAREAAVAALDALFTAPAPPAPPPPRKVSRRGLLLGA
jgi:[NiFe] hydrogenase assembly HybE family chaperone